MDGRLDGKHGKRVLYHFTCRPNYLLRGAAEIIRVKNETFLSQYRACNVLAWRGCGVYLVWRSSF
jgi:hypothetical protein